MEQIADIPFMNVELPAVAESRNEVVFPLNNLLPEIIDDRNLEESFDDLVGNLENKHQREHHRKKRTETLKNLKKDLADGTFHLDISELRELYVKDGYKPRIVHAPPVYKRIGVQAIMKVVEKYIYPTFITNTAASIKNRGMHWLHHIVEEDIKAAPENMQYYGQSDVFHFYDEIAQDTMKAIIRQYIADSQVLAYLDNFITLMPYGLSKGLRSSQGLANLYLSDVDKIMCQEVSYHVVEIFEGINDTIVKGNGSVTTDNCDVIHYHYYRYCDDIVFFCSNKKDCWRLYDILKRLLAERGLTIKSSFAIRPISEGLDFLGYKTFGIWKNIKGEKVWEVYSLLRKRIKKKAARALHRVKSRKRRQQIIGSFKGMASHANCKNLYIKLTGQHMARFNEMNLPAYAPEDGKKRFNCASMQLCQIANRPIEILSVETDVITRYGARHLAKFRFKGDLAEYKFFTDCKEMKFHLENMKVILEEMQDDSSVNDKFIETTIKQVPGSGALRIYEFT